MNAASVFLLKLKLLLVLITIFAGLCIQFLVQAFAIEGVRVEGQGTLGDESGHKDKNGDDGELHTGNIPESFRDVSPTTLRDVVDVTSEKRRSDCVDDDIGRIEESHNGAEG